MITLQWAGWLTLWWGSGVLAELLYLGSLKRLASDVVWRRLVKIRFMECLHVETVTAGMIALGVEVLVGIRDRRFTIAYPPKWLYWIGKVR